MSFVINPYVFAGGGPALWTPAQITTVGWWDFNDHASMTLNGNKVANVPDLSTNEDKDMAQSTDANRPITSTLNGLDAIRFDASTKSLTGGATGDFNDWHDGSGASYFMVVNFDSTTQFLKEFWTTLNGTSGFECRLRQETTKVGVFAEENDVLLHNWTSPDNALALATDIIFSMTTDINQDRDTLTWLNAVQDVTGVNYSNTPVGGYDSGPLRLGGDALHTLGELVVLDNVPSTSDRQKIEGYLAHKWDLESLLPVGHPYKSSAPTV